MRKATRDRLVLPLLIPLGALVVIAIPVFGFSRILLSVSAHGATITALAVAVGIMVVAARLSSLPRIRAATLVGMLAGVAGIAMIAGGVALATIGSGAAEGHGGPGGPPPKTITITAPVGAATKGFEQTKVAAPADVPVQIKFDNMDTDTHNVHVFSDDKSTQSVAEGKIFAGPGSEDIPLGTLNDGTYYFRCDVHPTTMIGEIDATPGGGTQSPGAPGGGTTPSAGGPPPTTGGAPPPGGASAGPIDITAQNLVFDKTSLSLPANTQVTIHFTNNDPSTQHNIGIYSADPATDPSAKELFKGDPVTGPGSTDYTVNPLPAGSYHFQCDFHPDTMKGTVTVG
jgi:plastocyanin